MKKVFVGIGLVIVVVSIVLSQSLFTISQWQTAIVLRLGEPIDADLKPGLHFKIPFINTVVKLDKRIQNLNLPVEPYLTAAKKNLLVDSFLKWEISDTTKFYRTMNNIENANNRLFARLKSGLKNEFGRRNVKEVISGQRSQIMLDITKTLGNEYNNFGIKIIDVRIKKVDFPKDINSAVYKRMEAERARAAKYLRSQGDEEAAKITSTADKQRTIILSEAYKTGQILRGEGDQQAARIYARAYGKKPEFYSFYRSLDAYVQSFQDKSDLLLLDSGSNFLKYFENSK